MKNQQKGFVSPLLVIIAIIVISGGTFAYFYNEKQNSQSADVALSTPATPETSSVVSSDGISPVVSVEPTTNEESILLNTPPEKLAKPNFTLADRVARLQKGVAIILWFAFPNEETDAYFNSHITDDDLSFLERSGFTHVRLAIAPQYIFNPSSETKINAHMLPFIDKAITRIIAHHMAVVVDIHDGDEQKTFENDKNAADFVPFWSNFSKHLTRFDANAVFLELLNEPVFEGNTNKWLALQNKLIKTIRDQAPMNTIIATGANWGGVEGLVKITPYADTNIIYSLHYYEPFAFTHQGADWAGPELIPIANLVYPYDATNCAQVLDTLTAIGSRTAVQEYCDTQWNKKSIADFVQQAVDWSKVHSVPIWAGEFGVYCKQTPRQSKLQWTKDVVDVFKQNHIGWALWAYDDCFGLDAKNENENIIYDKEALKTLNVHQ